MSTTPRTITVWRRATRSFGEGGVLDVTVFQAFNTVSVESTDDAGRRVALWQMEPSEARAMAADLTAAAARIERNQR